MITLDFQTLSRLLDAMLGILKTQQHMLYILEGNFALLLLILVNQILTRQSIYKLKNSLDLAGRMAELNKRQKELESKIEEQESPVSDPYTDSNLPANRPQIVRESQ